MDIQLRPYRAEDAAVTADIFRRAILDTAAKDYTEAEIAAWSRVDDLDAWARRRAASPTWIALIEGDAAGFADLAEGGLLDMMFVHPRFLGRGVASTLLAQVEAYARLQGFAEVKTEASRTARPFFERKGFEVVRAQRVEKRGQSLENFVMRKPLST